MLVASGRGYHRGEAHGRADRAHHPRNHGAGERVEEKQRPSRDQAEDEAGSQQNQAHLESPHHEVHGRGHHDQGKREGH